MALKRKVSQKVLEADLIKTMKQWEGVEDESIKMSRAVQARADNPLMQPVMEIIAHDSAMHRRVQEFIIDSAEKAAVTLAPEDLEEIWSQIDKHVKEQRKTMELADQATASSRAYVQRYLLNYLLEDELKHDMLLEGLEE